MYLENLNVFLSRLSFLNFTGQILKDLDSLIEWVDYGNDHLFNPIGYKFSLFLFEATYKKDEDDTIYN